MNNLPTPLQAALAAFAPRMRISELKREALSGKLTGLFSHPLVLDGEFSRRAYLARSVGQHADAEADRVARVAK